MNVPASTSVGGFLQIKSARQLIDEQRRDAELANNQPVIQGLATHIRRAWTLARTAKLTTVEPRMLQSLRQRRGEYDPDVLAQIREQGGTEIYMMLTSNKCRAASAWMRDVLQNPWSIEPTPLPDLPPD